MSGTQKADLVPLAESAAQKYGIDPSKFIDFIDKKNPDWNPYKVFANGTGGIAALSADQAQALGVNTFDPSQALDGAARLYATISKTMNNDILGINNAYSIVNTPADAKDVAGRVLSGDDLIDAKSGEVPNEVNNPQFLKDPVGYLQQTLINIGVPLLFGSISIMLIVLAIYILVMKNKGF